MKHLWRINTLENRRLENIKICYHGITGKQRKEDGIMHDYNNAENETIEDKIMIFVWGVTLGVIMWRIYELFTLGIWSL